MNTTISSIFTFLIYTIIFVCCLLQALFPKWCWKNLESWKATKEPSKTYFLTKRVIGIIGMVLIAAIALAPTLISYFDK